jgi:hypothetical protein
MLHADGRTRTVLLRRRICRRRIAFGLGSQWALMGAFIAIAAAFFVVAIRSGRASRT